MLRLDPRSWPIRWRLTALNVGVLATTLFLLGGASLWQLDGALVSITGDHLRDQATLAVPPPDSVGPNGPIGPFGGLGKPAGLGRPDGAGKPDAAGKPDGTGKPDGLGRSEGAAKPDGAGKPDGDGPGDRGRGGPPPFTLERVAEGLVRRLAGFDTGVLVFRPDGTLVASSDADLIAPEWPRAGAEQLAVAASHGESRAVVEQDGHRVLVLVLPLRSPSREVIGTLELARSLDLTDVLEDRLRVILAVGTAVALVVAGILSLRATRAALGPLEQVVRAARKIEAGYLDERLRLVRRDEIGDLAEAFDRMLDRLAAVLVAQRRFVADAAHELRTPLTILSGMVEMLQMGAHGGDPITIRRIHDTMERELGRLGRLVADLLTLSRLDAVQPLATDSVEIAPIVTEVAQQTRLLAQGQDVRLTVDAAPTVRGDADRLKQVLLNLASNALAFTPAGGRIEFGLGQVDGRARVAVTDTGSGIEPDLLPRVLDRFARGDPSRTRATGGSGLGLAIARGIVEAHGGSISLESEVGKGTCAVVELPACPAH